MNDPSNDESSKPTGSETTAVPPGEVHDEASSIAGETMEQVGAAGGESPHDVPDASLEKSTGRSAFLVGSGILISRIFFLILQRVSRSNFFPSTTPFPSMADAQIAHFLPH